MSYISFKAQRLLRDMCKCCMGAEDSIVRIDREKHLFKGEMPLGLDMGLTKDYLYCLSSVDALIEHLESHELLHRIDADTIKVHHEGFHYGELTARELGYEILRSFLFPLIVAFITAWITAALAFGD